MTNTLIGKLQEYLGAQIEKISPNTQAIDETTRHHRYDLLAQAAVPAVLAAFYKYTRMEEGVKHIIADEGKEQPLDYLLGDKKTELISRVAEYSKVDINQAELTMDAVADECIRMVRNELGSTYTPENLQIYFAGQRPSILSCLPEDLQLGQLLNDSTIDDRTNKMSGPASGLAQAIQNLFSSSGVEKE